MSDETKKGSPFGKRSWLIAGIVLLLMIVGMMFYRDILHAKTAADILGTLSDCFFVPGVLYAAFAGLSWVAKNGLFDALSYMFTNFSVGLLVPGLSKKKAETLYDYKQRKEEKGRIWFSHLLILGLSSVALGGIALLLYYLI